MPQGVAASESEARAIREAESDRQVEATMGSFLEAAQASRDEDAYFDAMYQELNIPRPSTAPRALEAARE